MSYAPIQAPTTLNHNQQDSRTQDNNYQSAKPFRKSGTQRGKSVGNGRVARRKSASDYPIIVHCHLCWDWVWQRPQQFISRLNPRHKILFIETIGPDPELAAPVARFRQAPDQPNITILRLQFPSWRWSDGDYVDRERRRIVQEFLAGPLAGQFDEPIQWFYDPMAVRAFAGQMGESLTVYDCMDELSQFKGAPPEMLEREAELLARADVVFTGGRKLFESKSAFNDNCHFYGCGVEGAHFGKARRAGTQVHEDLKPLTKPVLGYFGVIDERLDYDLIAQLADANPNWSVAMIGPVLKVQPDSLPRRANLHWLGQRPYAELPALCKGFDLCLMPFALNESTEFINPTKALEYMATGRQVISTAVADVVSNFGGIVSIARGPEEFIEHCRQAVQQEDRQAIERGLKMVGQNSWESIVAKLEKHVEEALRKTGSERLAL